MLTRVLRQAKVILVEVEVGGVEVEVQVDVTVEVEVDEVTAMVESVLEKQVEVEIILLLQMIYFCM